MWPHFGQQTVRLHLSAGARNLRLQLGQTITSVMPLSQARGGPDSISGVSRHGDGRSLLWRADQCLISEATWNRSCLAPAWLARAPLPSAREQGLHFVDD